MIVTCLRRREPWLHQRAQVGLRVSSLSLCRQTEPERDGRMARDGKEWVCPYCVRWAIVQELGIGVEGILRIDLILLDMVMACALVPHWPYRSLFKDPHRTPQISLCRHGSPF